MATEGTKISIQVGDEFIPIGEVKGKSLLSSLSNLEVTGSDRPQALNLLKPLEFSIDFKPTLKRYVTMRFKDHAAFEGFLEYLRQAILKGDIETERERE